MLAEHKRRLARLIRTVKPGMCRSTYDDDDILALGCYWMFRDCGLSIYPADDKLTDSMTLEDFYDNYERFNESAIINDGRCIGFKKGS